MSSFFVDFFTFLDPDLGYWYLMPPPPPTHRQSLLLQTWKIVQVLGLDWVVLLVEVREEDGGVAEVAVLLQVGRLAEPLAAGPALHPPTPRPRGAQKHFSLLKTPPSKKTYDDQT
jgi:hypothetical protein